MKNYYTLSNEVNGMKASIEITEKEAINLIEIHGMIFIEKGSGNRICSYTNRRSNLKVNLFKED